MLSKIRRFAAAVAEAASEMLAPDTAVEAVSLFEEHEDTPDPDPEPVAVYGGSSRTVYNVLSPSRCRHCHRTTKNRQLIGVEFGEEAGIVFFSSARDAAAWRENFVQAELEPSDTVAYALEEEADDASSD